MKFHVFWRAVGAIAIAVALGWSAWRYGLFFEADAYVSEMAIFAAAAIVLIWRALGRQGRELPPSAVSLLPLGVAVCYGIALLTGPLAHKGTVDAMLRWISYAGWVAVLTVWGRGADNRGWGEASIQSAGVLLLAGGWLGWFGGIQFTDIVLIFDDPELSSAGARLAGFLQYPNAFGAVMSFFLVRQWQGWAGQGKIAGAAASLLSVPYAGAVALTESRGAIAALWIGLALAIWLADDRGKRYRIAIAAAWTVPGAWVSVWAAWGSGVHADGAAAWLTAAVMLISAILLYGLRRRLAAKEQEEGKNPYSGAVKATVLLLLACAAAYAWLGSAGASERFAGGRYETASARMLFYADGWRMFLDSPWLGYGGDSWRSQFGLYQSEPYVGGEVHSGYLDLLLNVGLVGFAAAASMFGYWIWKIWRLRRDVLAPAAVLLAHSVIDFDLSYGWVWLLLLAWFALFAADESAGRPQGWRRPAGAGATAALLIAASAWGGYAAWHGHAAARAADAADRAATAAVPAAREANLRAARAAHPAWTRIRLALASLLPQARERESVLAAGLRYEPQSAPLLLQLGLAEAELGLVAQAETRLREALRLDRFSREAQTAAIAAMARASEALRFGGNGKEAQRAAEASVFFYERYRGLVREVEAMDDPSNGRRFEMTTAAEFHAAQALIALGREEEARSLLLTIVGGDDSGWQEQARELMRKLNRTGQENPSSSS